MSENKRIILSAKDIEVQFRVRDNYLTAIRNVSLDLYDGETFAIVGESGSGKSVFTKTFTGMLESNGKITNGSIMFEGKDLTKLVTDKDWEGIRGKKISTIFQDPMTSLNPIRTIGSQITEVIMKHQGVSAAEAKKQAIDIMNKVGITNAEQRFDAYPFQYSGGMRQRIVIAIALSCHPDILICDEPTTALDVTIQAQVLQLIKDLQKEYKFTTIYITHDLGVVANVADRVGVMYGGQIVEYGTVEEIFYDPHHPYTWALLSSLPQLGVKGEDLFYITGTPPSLYNKIKGDAFAPRNIYALKIDFEEEPPFFKISDTHYAKTWLLDPRAPKVEKPEVIQNLHEKITAMTSEGGAYYVKQD
ncbi:MAG: ABC transporter ATP-binding protein [Erysipelotrichaceae bacterium]|nr:ABC transporter ATP-binding protein [Erysipelotrichaceae bacterium]